MNPRPARHHSRPRLARPARGGGAGDSPEQSREEQRLVLEHRGSRPAAKAAVGFSPTTRRATDPSAVPKSNPPHGRRDRDGGPDEDVVPEQVRAHGTAGVPRNGTESSGQPAI